MNGLYQRPDKVIVRVITGSGKEVSGARDYKPDDMLWGKRAGDLPEGVYEDDGQYLGSFSDYWQGKPAPIPVQQRTGWWSKRLLGGK